MCESLEKASIIHIPQAKEFHVQFHCTALDKDLEKGQDRHGPSWDTTICNLAQRKCGCFRIEVMPKMYISPQRAFYLQGDGRASQRTEPL